MSLTLGADDHGECLKLDLDKLGSTAILANPGGGKSWCVRRFLEVTQGKIQQIVIDPEDEFFTLREKGDYILLGGENGDAPLSVDTAEQVALMLLEHGISAILQLNDWDWEEQQAFVGRFTEALVGAPKRLWRPVLIVVDEAPRFIPQDSTTEASRGVTALLNQGRKRGFTTILASQRLATIDKDATGAVLNWLIGRVGQSVDRRTAADALGFGANSAEARAMTSWDEGWFYAFGPALSRMPKKFRVGMVETTHVRPGHPEIPTPPAPKMLKALLAGLAKAAASAEQSHTSEKGSEAVQPPSQAARDAIFAEGRREGFIAGVQSGLVRGNNSAAGHMMALAQKLLDEPPMLVDGEPTEIEARFGPLPPMEIGFTGVPKPPVEVTSSRTRGELILGKIKTIGAADRIATFVEPTEVNVEGSEVAVNHPSASGVATSLALKEIHTTILGALAAWEKLTSQRSCRRETLAFLCKNSHKSGYFARMIGELKTAGLASYPIDGEVGLTDFGRSVAPHMNVAQTNDAVQRELLSRLPQVQQRIMEILLEEHPKDITRDGMAERAGASTTSGYFARQIGELKTLGYLDYPSQGRCIAASLLFPYGIGKR